ncbi:uncharacterized protein At2g24330-like [Dendrobium catenatum]|uniref:Lunapark zinc ribbon domain-containing protein n=1 Tax=Dendrobium catenatum TaxID=906689 RepID=A0A2I0XF69_9ASPA|nr:uncharacterized protein At2g24330-like [Dendrobium catenatum]PKU86539.1 Uncharacterized protein MA16_Dca010575 [Dendrobium catenatum]
MEEPGGDDPTEEGEAAKASVLLKRGQRMGIISRIWRRIFGVGNEDYEKKLQLLSKEEAVVHTKMKRRAQSSRKRARNLIMLSMTFEVVAVAVAVTAIRSLDLTGPMKFFRTLPAILLPGLSYVVYSLLECLTRMLDRKDQNTLERLRAERKAKIDELKERTNYYTTQQLIQRYDLDPAAQIAAATVLASRLGAESGLNVHIGDDPTKTTSTTKSSGIEQVQSGVSRQRKHSSAKKGTTQLPESSNDVAAPGQMVVEHYKGSGTTDGGWVGRIAALLVGEDPSNCYALICGNCHKHNGLSRKEDFPHVTYYCPHCHALNTSKQIGDQELLVSGSHSSLVTSAGAKNYVAESIQELPESAAD